MSDFAKLDSRRTLSSPTFAEGRMGRKSKPTPMPTASDRQSFPLKRIFGEFAIFYQHRKTYKGEKTTISSDKKRKERDGL
jgi:hypothetical protein